ncbi:MAG: SGNH/GDSL hydrolase family protein [Aeromicrobium sp.]|uniref:SGNH/GDSL hydrolase family protein n=1 Tax=Aeromicrobium sp. TaxID=1871063 RepID=UPI003C666426
MLVRGVVCSVAALVALTSACTSDAPSVARPTAAPQETATTEPSPAPLTGRYVAIGDSFSAGPGISPIDQESGFCLRSTANFPSLVAEQLSKSLTDVSCSGASTTTVLEGADGPRGTVEPQIDAVTADTDLVTIGLGGNDGGLFQTLIQSCVEGAAACQQFVSAQAPAVLATTTDRLARLLRSVTSRAPDATVALVGYPRLSPATGSCAAAGIDASAQDLVRSAEILLDDALRAAAEAASVQFVSLRDASTGHDACAGSQAWTNGDTAANGDGIVFHPRATGMRAIAAVVARALS